MIHSTSVDIFIYPDLKKDLICSENVPWQLNLPDLYIPNVQVSVLPADTGFSTFDRRFDSSGRAVSFGDSLSRVR